MAYPVGQALNVEHRYFDSDGALADGTTVTATVTAPNGTVTVYTYGVDAQYVKVAIGVYRLTFTGTSAGTWRVTGDATSVTLEASTTDTYAFVATVTAASWVARTERLLGVQHKTLNKLATAPDATADTLTFSREIADIGVGSILSVGLETMYVWDTNPTTKRATVERGFDGSTADLHAVGDIVFVNPVFPRFAVFQALNDQLGGLDGAGLFAVRTLELTYSPVIAGYDLAGAATTIDSVYMVEWKSTGLTSDWRLVPDWKFLRDQDAVDFPSGFGLRVDSGQTGQPLRVTYLTSFSALADLNGDVEDTGLHTEAWDIPALGAAAALLMPEEARRNDPTTQGDARRSTEVPPGAVARSAAFFQQRRDQRIVEERTRLRRRYPVRSTV